MVFTRLSKESDPSNYWDPQNFDRYGDHYIAVDQNLPLHHDGFKEVQSKNAASPS